MRQWCSYLYLRPHKRLRNRSSAAASSARQCCRPRRRARATPVALTGRGRPRACSPTEGYFQDFAESQANRLNPYQTVTAVWSGLVSRVKRVHTTKPMNSYMPLQKDGISSTTHNVLEQMLPDESAKPTKLPLSLLEAITNNFSSEQVIGRGGFAVVYKGILRNGTVAVKKLSKTLDMHEKAFSQEVQCLVKVRHKNIVRFLGYCADTQGEMADYEGKFVMADVRNRLLCFEFVPNGSLHDYITDASCGLEWRVRYQMIKEICDGLHYLHENHIVHLDLKPSNILLDDSMVPKITDFGLSRCFDENQSKAITSKLIGSIGYLAPEFYNGQITFKLDIYSLGVIVIEMLTGQKGYSTVEKILESWRNKLEISHKEIALQQVRACAEIGIMCIDSNPENRPITQHIIKTFKELGSTNEFVEAGASSSAAQVSTLNYNLASLPRRKRSFVAEDSGLAGASCSSQRSLEPAPVSFGVNFHIKSFSVNHFVKGIRANWRRLIPLREWWGINPPRSPPIHPYPKLKQGEAGVSSSATQTMTLNDLAPPPVRLRRPFVAEDSAWTDEPCSSSSSAKKRQRSLGLRPSCSLDLALGAELCIRGSAEGEVDELCRCLGLSGPEEFAVPLAAWEEHKSRSNSHLAARPSLVPSPPADELSPIARAVSSAPNVVLFLPPPINALAPPPMRRPIVADDMTGSAWDLVLSFAPSEERSELGGAHERAIRFHPGGREVGISMPLPITSLSHPPVRRSFHCVTTSMDERGGDIVF